MDSAIDPSIRDHDKDLAPDLGRQELPPDLGNDLRPNSSLSHPNGDLHNVFTLNEYMNHGSDPDMSHDESAEAALKMMDFSSNGSDVLMEPVDQSHSTSHGSSTASPIIGVDSTKMQMVEYDHKSKPLRLGRPRNHVLKNLKINPEDSTHNASNSKYMLYRLDDQPVEGPGSRGGKGSVRKQKGKITSEAFRKRKRQSQLVFGGKGVGLLAPEDKKMDKEDVPETVHSDKDLEIVQSAPETETVTEVETVPEPVETTAAPKEIKKTKRKMSSLQSTSRTTVLNGRHKVTRQFPGPLVPLFYDIYDENYMDSNPNTEAKAEKLALGFPVKKVNHGIDVIYILCFCCKFYDLLGIGKIGPQDIEQGLGLEADLEESKVSPLMDTLFARLLTLVLNRKPEVNPRFPGKAVSELKALSRTLGLPREWKDNNEAYSKVSLDKDQAIPVDPAKPDILLEEGYTFHASYIYENPFNDKQGFEKLGISGIQNPHDRLILLRTLVDWSLTSSNDIKAFIADILLKQDIPGDKETYYGSRAVLKGFKHTHDLTKETNTKIQKKNYSEDNEILQRYIEPVADPLQHPLRLRVDEQVVGDLGFHIGRFYLCRTAEPEDGGLSSVKRMEQIRENPVQIKSSNGARFKLYVQDTYKLLVEGLTNEGVEFDEDGNEVLVDTNPDELPDGHFYEVALNASQLELFVTHLSQRLGLILDEDTTIISPTSAIYKPTVALYEYLWGLLPLLREQETLAVDSRPSRTRNVDYSAKVDYEELEELEDFPMEDDDEDDDYVSE